MKFPLAFSARRSVHFAIAGLATVAVAAVVATVDGCNGDDDTTTSDVRGPASCAPPSGMDCCAGDTGEGHWVCGADNATICQDQTTLQPSSNCSFPAGTAYPADAAREAGGDATDAAPDARTCSLPVGMACCDGDEEEDSTCSADGSVICPDPTLLVPVAACTLPGPFDAGTPADASDAGDAIADAAHD